MYHDIDQVERPRRRKPKLSKVLLFAGVSVTFVTSLVSLYFSVLSYHQRNLTTEEIPHVLNKKETTEAPTGTTPKTWTPRPNDDSECDPVTYRNSHLKCKLTFVVTQSFLPSNVHVSYIHAKHIK
jgi:hypothetical protein